MVLKKQKSDKSSRGLFKVNTLGVIFDPRTRKILIGKKEKELSDQISDIDPTEDMVEDADVEDSEE